MRASSSPDGSMAAHILVVDDVLVNRRVALGQLKRLGYRADARANGKEAVEALQDTHMTWC